MNIEISNTFQWLDHRHRPDGQAGKRRFGRLGQHRHAQRDRRPRWASPTCSSTWRSRAPPARSAAPDRRRDRSGGRLSQRLYQPRADRLPCPRAESRCAAGAGHPRRHSHQPHLRSGRTGARTPGGAAGDRPGARHARRYHLRSSADRDLSRTSRWAGRSWARRRRSPPSRRAICATTCARAAIAPKA